MYTDRQIDRLFRWFKRRPSDVVRNAIVEQYLSLIEPEAARIHRRLPRSVEQGDLLSDGFFGLLDAIASFDPERGEKFATFARYRIIGAILDGLRSRDSFSRGTRQRVKNLEAASEKLRATHGRQPSPDEVAREMDAPIETYSRAALATRETATRSLSGGRIWDDDRGELSAEHLRDTREHDPVSVLERKLLRDKITASLTQAEKLIVTLYYYEGLTLKEIGEVLDLSESRVSQIRTSIVLRLKATLTISELEAA